MTVEEFIESNPNLYGTNNVNLFYSSSVSASIPQAPFTIKGISVQSNTGNGIDIDSALKGVEIESFLDNQNLSAPVPNSSSVIEELPPKIMNLRNEIEIYFNKHKPYLEPDLTLVTLAKMLNTSREELSETINKGYKLRFNEFINQYRIEEFKARIAQGMHKQLSLLSSAYECGFNSKATFNRAFKKTTDLSPSEYLKTI